MEQAAARARLEVAVSSNPTPHSLPATSRPGPRPPFREAEGVVVRVDRATALLESPRQAGAVRATWGGALLSAVAADPEAAPCTGDVVTWRSWGDGRVTVESVRPRRTLLTRGDVAGTSHRQLLAANVDVVAVVEGLLPDPDARRIARLLTLAWSSGAEPVVLLTKADLVPDVAQLAAELAIGAGCPVLPVSAITGDGVEGVRALLDGGRVMALLGASGVGKSSLVNALAGDDVMQVNSLRADGKGRHTTVTRELHRVAGGAVIDSPGLRSVGLADATGLDLTFADVLHCASGCRFSDCSHGREPGCAVQAAVDAGDLDEGRVEAWRQLVEEGRRQEIRRDARLLAERRRQRRIQSRAMRRLGTPRP